MSLTSLHDIFPVSENLHTFLVQGLQLKATLIATKHATSTIVVFWIPISAVQYSIHNPVDSFSESIRMWIVSSRFGFLLLYEPFFFVYLPIRMPINVNKIPKVRSCPRIMKICCMSQLLGSNLVWTALLSNGRNLRGNHDRYDRIMEVVKGVYNFRQSQDHKFSGSSHASLVVMLQCVMLVMSYCNYRLSWMTCMNSIWKNLIRSEIHFPELAWTSIWNACNDGWLKCLHIMLVVLLSCAMSL